MLISDDSFMLEPLSPCLAVSRVSQSTRVRQHRDRRLLLHTAVDGKRDDETRPLVHFAHHLDGSPVLLNNLLADGKPEPGSSTHAFGGKHRIEDVLERLGCDAFPAIFHLYSNSRVPALAAGHLRFRQANLHPAAPGHGVDAVVDQVQEYLLEVASVGAYAGAGARKIGAHPDLSHFQSRRSQQHNL